MDGLTRVSVASAEKNYHGGNCENHDLQEAAHLKRVVGVPFGRNSTDVLFEWPAKTSVLMGSDCFARDNHFRPENFHFKFTSRGAKRRRRNTRRFRKCARPTIPMSGYAGGN